MGSFKRDSQLAAPHPTPSVNMKFLSFFVCSLLLLDLTSASQESNEVEKGQEPQNNPEGRRGRMYIRRKNIESRKEDQAKRKEDRRRKHQERKEESRKQQEEMAERRELTNRKPQGRKVIKGEDCNFIRIASIVTEASGCSDGDKFVIKTVNKTVRKQFVIMLGEPLLVFVTKGKKFLNCTEFKDITSTVSCKTISGLANINITANLVTEAAAAAGTTAAGTTAAGATAAAGTTAAGATAAATTAARTTAAGATAAATTAAGATAAATTAAGTTAAGTTAAATTAAATTAAATTAAAGELIMHMLILTSPKHVCKEKQRKLALVQSHLVTSEQCDYIWCTQLAVSLW